LDTVPAETPASLASSFCVDGIFESYMTILATRAAMAGTCRSFYLLQ
jgi:hypothetical protein